MNRRGGRLVLEVYTTILRQCVNKRKNHLSSPNVRRNLYQPLSVFVLLLSRKLSGSHSFIPQPLSLDYIQQLFHLPSNRVSTQWR